ncbi:MAG: transglycosylase domain-containing protein [Gaiellaceae bacterium]
MGWLWRYRRVWFLFGLLGFTALAGAVWVITQIPLPSEAPLAQTTLIYDSSGAQVAELHGVENRFPVKIEQVPAITQAAVIAAEDRHFLEHRGVDPLGIMRATWADIRHKGVTQGASTITQQYVKNQIVGSERSLVRKLKEAVVAVKLERKYAKPEILEKYLNTVYFGRGAYGIQAASQAYFNKDVDKLDLQESAYLAGLIRTPSTGDVYVDRDSAYYLRTSVLRNMVRAGSITRADADQVEKVKIENYVFAPEPSNTTFTHAENGAEYFVEYVRQKLVDTYGEDRVLRGGLRVYTTLDPKAQELAYHAVYDTLFLDDDPAGALVSLDPDGRVVAMVGGKDWSQSEVNLATGRDGGGQGRQAGSSFKPFVLAEAIRRGMSPDSKYYAAPPKIGPLRGWEQEVNNYGGAGFGTINLTEATVNSVNTVYAQLINDVGAENVVTLAHKMGITSELNAVPSITLGTQEVSVLEMADAYLTLFNNGMHTDPRVFTKITEGGSVLVDDKPSGRERALSREVAEQVKEILGEVIDRGSGTRAQLPGGAWGKTGTTDEYGDAWFVGASDRLTTAVWMGYPEGQSHAMKWVHGFSQVAGGTLPAYIFQKFMYEADPGEAKPPSKAPALDTREVSQTGGRSSSGAGSSSSGSDSSGASSSSGSSDSPSTTVPAETATTVASPSATVPATTPTTERPPVLTAPSVPFTTPTTPSRTARTSIPRPEVPEIP